uniref:TIL domain containing protein n=1 Tax=Rhipicephalus zambeziensis TaxID=60191 RepID=A0A224YFI5_9ACAR
MAKMAIMSLAVMVVMCSFLLPATGQEPAAEAMALRGGRGWYAPQWPNLQWPNWQWPIWPRCQWGEVYKQCVSSSCAEKKCSQIGQPTQNACTYDCASGCFCMKGFYRNNYGRCVMKIRCPRHRITWPVPYGSE